MAHFSSGEVREMLRAVEERRAVCVSGAARSGLSRWTSDFVTERFSPATALEGGLLDSVPLVAKALRLMRGEQLLSPSQARIAHQDSRHDAVVWISNFHLVPQEVRTVVARYLFADDGIASVHKAVVVEGAVDFHVLRERAFPEGSRVGPLVALNDEAYPWRSLTEVNDLASEIAPRLPSLVIPWIVDSTGGDLGLALETMTSLRALEPDDIDDQALAATWKQVAERSMAAKAIRRSVNATTRGAAYEALLAGRVVTGEPISRCEDPQLRDLFFSGLVTYDRAARGYRIRGPLTGAILATGDGAGRGGGSVIVQDTGAIGARTAVVLLELARLELQLRAAVMERDWLEEAKGVTTPSQWKGAGRRAADAIARSEIADQAVRNELVKLVRQTLPDEASVLDVARERAERAGARDERLLDHLGLSEMLAVAGRLGVLEPAMRNELDTALVGVRNALAHFRGVQYSAAVRAVRLAMKAVRQILSRPGTPSRHEK